MNHKLEELLGLVSTLQNEKKTNKCINCGCEAAKDELELHDGHCGECALGAGYESVVNEFFTGELKAAWDKMGSRGQKYLGDRLVSLGIDLQALEDSGVNPEEISNRSPILKDKEYLVFFLMDRGLTIFNGEKEIYSAEYDSRQSWKYFVDGANSIYSIKLSDVDSANDKRKDRAADQKGIVNREVGTSTDKSGYHSDIRTRLRAYKRDNNNQVVDNIDTSPLENAINHALSLSLKFNKEVTTDRNGNKKIEISADIPVKDPVLLHMVKSLKVGADVSVYNGKSSGRIDYSYRHHSSGSNGIEIGRFSYDQASDKWDIRFNKDSALEAGYESMLEYDNVELDDGLLLEPTGVIDGEFKVKINGAEYGYKPSPDYGNDISALEKEFLYKMAYPGKALAWLKANTILTSRPGGGKVAKSPGDKAKVLNVIQIPSSSGSGSYDCKKHDDGAWTCTCPHHMNRGVECKHIKQAQDQLNKGVEPGKIAASATGESKLEFSPKLKRAIEMEIQAHHQELGDELDGVEEIIGDNLGGEARQEWEKLLKDHGYDALTKAVKKKFNL